MKGTFLGAGGKTLVSLYGWLTLPYSATMLAIRVVFSSRRNFLLVPEGGFGHTIEQPFIFLSLTKGDGTCVVLCAGNKCNREVNRLFMGKTHFIQVSPNVKKLTSSSSSVKSVLTRLASALFRLSGKSYWDLERINLIARENGFGDLGLGAHLGLFYKLAWEQDIESPEFQVPVRVRNKIVEVDDSPKIAFYLRGKGKKNPIDASDFTRDGGPLSSYESFLSPLINFGFKIIPIGEADKIDLGSLSPELKASILTAKDIGITERELALYSPIVADFYAGNAGGCGILATLGRRRAVILDGFGYWYAIPNALISLKILANEVGETIPSLENFSRDIFDCSIPEKYVLKGLSSAEQRALAEEFLRLIDSNWNLQEGAHKRPEFSAESWHRFSPNSRLSDTYMEAADLFEFYGASL